MHFTSLLLILLTTPSTISKPLAPDRPRSRYNTKRFILEPRLPVERRLDVWANSDADTHNLLTNEQNANSGSHDKWPGPDPAPSTKRHGKSNVGAQEGDIAGALGGGSIVIGRSGTRSRTPSSTSPSSSPPAVPGSSTVLETDSRDAGAGNSGLGNTGDGNAPLTNSSSSLSTTTTNTGGTTIALTTANTPGKPQWNNGYGTPPAAGEVDRIGADVCGNGGCRSQEEYCTAIARNGQSDPKCTANRPGNNPAWNNGFGTPPAAGQVDRIGSDVCGNGGCTSLAQYCAAIARNGQQDIKCGVGGGVEGEKGATEAQAEATSTSAIAAAPLKSGDHWGVWGGNVANPTQVYVGGVGPDATDRPGGLVVV